MSRIDGLVSQLCPNGVQYRPLQALGRWYGGGTPSKHRDDFWRNGTIPWLSPKDMRRPTLASTEDMITQAAVGSSPTKLVPANAVAVVVRSSILDQRWPTALVTIPVTLNQDMKALACGPDVLPAYVAHLFRSVETDVLRATRKTGGSVASIDVPRLMRYRVPVPPLELQQEIVRVLDTFSQLAEELEAELEARRRQYEHYRDSLLTFGEDDVRWATLGEICTRVSSGATPTAGRPEYYEGGGIPWLRTAEVRFIDIWDTEVKITERAVAETAVAWIPANCVVVAISGATAARCGVNKIPLTTNQHCCNLEVDPLQASYRYVFHWVSARYTELKAKGQGARCDLNAGLIKSYPIALPPLAEQQRLARGLDAFDALVNDLSTGLPAELSARRKQYEHYRDRLLTFRELAV